MRRYAFTLIELIFVIVIMGLLSKFGVEFLARAYDSFIASSINNSLQSKSAMAVETIATRLQFRIKDSIIARQPGVTYQALASSTLAESATVLEWIGYDIDGMRAGATPSWSGIIDLYHPNTTAATLFSPQTNTTDIDASIAALSDGGSSISSAALYFIGSNSDITAGYGWGGAIADHNNSTIHPINSTGAGTDRFVTGITGVNFNGADLYEYYQLAWSAYAVSHEGANLWLYYDYQPWLGETYLNGKKVLLMQNVDTFRFKAIGSIVKIQVCVNQSILVGKEYSLCKEKTIF
ncbi:type II secretion system protein [Sulfurimonas sp.]|uniref:type II secretion system protein n=1 Tax=Sulfurimonas sp. TaxID=2022749 RepID=UPI00261AD453|nr:prepilin-type N-terminal cleavage/methylation domain-containing protein [Sulfurimonas sp.]MDD5158068.1 prepilin-type N-terminal cleavage/methylation domain-containing protein [Sulfurimonas sp.]